MLLAGAPTVGADLREAQVSRPPNERGLGELAEPIMILLDSSYININLRSVEGRHVGPPGVTFPPAGPARSSYLSRSTKF